MHRERYRARRRLQAAMARLDEAAPEDETDAVSELGAALREYTQLFLEDDEG